MTASGDRAGSSPSARIRNACTVVVLRDRAAGVEVLMLRRAHDAAFLGGAYVFPGGAVDAGDADARVLARLQGSSGAEADARLDLAQGGLTYWATGVRECFEETGILLARDAACQPVAIDRQRELGAMRRALHDGTMAFADFLEQAQLGIRTDDLVYVDHWITPPGRSRRFDTRFFWARLPAGQVESPDEVEAAGLEWIAPSDALARAESGSIELPNATRQMLRELARWPDVQSALQDGRGRGPIEVKRPVVAQGARGPVIFRNGDTAYAEIRWSDPDETTATTYDLEPGKPKRLDRHVVRIIAPNPGNMTGPGTNSYLVGHAEVAVIDPGPCIDSHIDAIVHAGAGRIRWILCTHTHPDHSPAAARLKAITGAQLIGATAPADARQDATFLPDVIAQDEAIYAVGDLTLRALHTPGHASNHYCYLLEQTGMLFSGDHVMQGSTVVINPPDGDMRAYLHSLQTLFQHSIAIIAPGHGYLIGKPAVEIRRLIEHRMQRERRVLDALAHRGEATIDELLPAVYPDVPIERHRAAARSLLAHLLKLVAEGRVRAIGHGYSLAI